MLNNKLSQISASVKDELNYFQDFFQESMKSKVGLIDLIARYIIRQKGKKIRPLLVLLSAKLSGGINERSYRGAVLVELLHTATLIHDDVVDNADKRRNFWSINKVFKNKVSVLMGDYLLARGLMLAVENEDFDFLKVITKAVKRMSEGELLQIQKTRKLDINEETYFQVISDKTASLIETCCLIGALSATENKEYQDALKAYGHNLGMSFQIRDDILDYEGQSFLLGKPIGGDIKEKKITLPLIYSLNKVDKKESDLIRSKIKNNNNKATVKEIIEFVRRNNGIEYAYQVSLMFAEKAKNSLSIFNDSEVKSALEKLVDFVTERKN
ncbi:MAG: polyprenyl synthetase family protein [Ignavibacterium sp.]|nr:polyprenyl synthetase family protein [Ignavibacterium sp.]MDW8375432.1 polyprenyl synthetase family protein [Ignavibacteriales bacterium]